MNLQALLIRATASIASGLMLTAAILIAGPAHTAATSTSIAPHAAVVGATQTQPVVLPTIHVRPTPQQRVAAAAADRRESPDAGADIIDAALRQDVSAVATPSLHGLEVDMPYYSFGKVLPRIGSKE